MLDHISIGIRDFEGGLAFYDAVLKTLGYARNMTFDRAAGYGGPGDPAGPQFWIGAPSEGETAPSRGFHVAFRAETRVMVDAFHEAALAAGARDNGKPGLRPEYHPNYYAAFVIDPEGHNLEAVCHKPE